MVHAPRPSQLVMVALVLLSVASVLNYAISQLGSGRLEGRIDSSWGLRTYSIRMGLTLNHSDLLNVAVGVGPGQVDVMSHWSGPPIPKAQGTMWRSGAWPSATTRRRDCWALRRCWPC